MAEHQRSTWSVLAFSLLVGGAFLFLFVIASTFAPEPSPDEVRRALSKTYGIPEARIEEWSRAVSDGAAKDGMVVPPEKLMRSIFNGTKTYLPLRRRSYQEALAIYVVTRRHRTESDAIFFAVNRPWPP